MYLDDGISRDSAPSHDYVPEISTASGFGKTHDLTDDIVDPKAKSQFCHVKISQVRFPSPSPNSLSSLRLQEMLNAQQKTTRVATEDGGDSTLRVNRKVTIRAPWNGYRDDLGELIGENYTIVFWHEINVPLRSVSVTSDKKLESWTEEKARATAVRVPLELANTTAGVTVILGHEDGV